MSANHACTYAHTARGDTMQIRYIQHTVTSFKEMHTQTQPAATKYTLVSVSLGCVHHRPNILLTSADKQMRHREENSTKKMESDLTSCSVSIQAVAGRTQYRMKNAFLIAEF